MTFKAVDINPSTPLLAHIKVLPGNVVSLNAFEAFTTDPDTCMRLMMAGAGISYISVELYEQAKQAGLEAVQSSSANLRTLVDAWYRNPELVFIAEAVDRAFLPK
ncbi:hypothetical protein [Eoetvoesiella caeni]|nr:hypothetical protein [Eoetvoesiella caeni]MCI2811287.1 hypothetical protein [Eoetvoesiella caeni]NYT57241.1 hypothetical protein [Eoetvoesiella caeni]